MIKEVKLYYSVHKALKSDKLTSMAGKDQASKQSQAKHLLIHSKISNWLSVYSTTVSILDPRFQTCMSVSVRVLCVRARVFALRISSFLFFPALLPPYIYAKKKESAYVFRV